MQVDSDYEIINLDPNVNYETDDDEDLPMEPTSEELKKSDEKYEIRVGTTDFVDENKTIILGEEENKQMVNDVDSVVNKEPCVLPSSSPNDIVVVGSEKPRKKLNLAEYKIVRAHRPAPVYDGRENVVLELCENFSETLPPIELPTDPRSIKALLMSQQQQADDLLQQPMQIDKEVEGSSNELAVPTALHPDYEEIVLVSIECCTDISIPPYENDEEYESKAPAKFLTNIVNTIQKDDNAKTLLNSTTSLFSSINAVLHEKCINPAHDITVKNEERKSSEHGENKVIMHLKKDRARVERDSFAIQTDSSPLFPPLILSPALIFNRIKNARNFRRNSRSRSGSRSRSRSRSFSPENDNYKHINSSYKYPRSLHSSTVNSSEFDSSSESDTSAYSSCRSSDYDSTKKFDNRFRQRYGNQRSNFQEERRIVYVGGLTEETSKDELRRKFLKYGTIKKISIHAKEDINGLLRFGFITFAESSAAYDVLDKFKTDSTLSAFDIRFGGRRKFCKQSYADLDSLPNENDLDFYNNNNTQCSKKAKLSGDSAKLSFEDLLNIAKRKLCKQK